MTIIIIITMIVRAAVPVLHSPVPQHGVSRRCSILLLRHLLHQVGVIIIISIIIIIIIISSECSTRGGSADGSCAMGFGVCCKF